MSLLTVRVFCAILEYNQRSLVTEILSAASPAHCGTLWRTLVSLLVVVAASMPRRAVLHCTYYQLYPWTLWVSASYYTVLTCKVNLRSVVLSEMTSLEQKRVAK